MGNARRSIRIHGKSHELEAVGGNGRGPMTPHFSFGN
jgi:hypothetical protein